MNNDLTPVEHELDFSPLHRAMTKYIDDEILSCMTTLVLRGTDVLDFKTYGYMDLETRQPLRTDGIFRMYSNTKLVTSVALMMLYEQGRFGLNDELAKYMPEWGDMQVLKLGAKNAADVEAPTEAIRIRHLLSHSAGLSYGFIEPESVIDQAYLSGGLNVLSNSSLTLEEFCAKAAALPLAYQPGSSWRYSIATDVCARLVEVLSGQTFDAFLAAHIFQPLGMVDTDFWVPPEKADRFTTMYAPVDLLDPMKPGLNKADDARAGQYNTKRAFLSGGGGLVSTMSDYMAFIRMIVNAGEWRGTRILQAATLDLMRTNQLARDVGVAFPMWAMPGTVFGLGFALKTRVGPDEPAAAIGEYHWGGMAGTHSWMAPNAGITGFCGTQRMPGFWHPFSHEFKALAYQIAS
ncbi:MAG: serine hydrolase [Pseudomonadales bacterium]|nr:serine hydrolase [Pseudomonadales bacterium]